MVERVRDAATDSHDDRDSDDHAEDDSDSSRWSHDAPTASASHSTPFITQHTTTRHTPRPRHHAHATTSVDDGAIALKQSELRRVVEGRIVALERTLAQREAELQRVHAKLRQVEEDYEFNYNLIAERDDALAQAASQLQRVYRDLKRVAQEKTHLQTQLAETTRQLTTAQTQLHAAEQSHAAALQRLRDDAVAAEQHLRETLRSKEAALNAERDALHARYMTCLQTTSASATDAASSPLRHAQDELCATAEQWRETRGQLAECERVRAALHAELTQLQHAHAELQAQHRALRAQTDADHHDRDTRTAQLESHVQETTALMEQTVRAEAARAAQLERDKDALQTTLHEMELQLRQCRASAAEETQRQAAQLREVRAEYATARDAAAETARQHEAVTRQLQHDVQTHIHVVEELRAELQRTTDAARRTDALLRTSRDEHAAVQQELRQVRDELAQLRRDAAAAAAHVQSERDTAAADTARLAQTARELQTECASYQRRLQELQERSQQEIARLTRELHLSESARRHAEEECQTLQDTNAQRALVRQLQLDKESLQCRVAELEKTNHEVREQVGRFAMELQNDPVLRAAKETQGRVQTLQQDLLRAQDELQRVRDTLHSREEELARCQVDLLRANLLSKEPQRSTVAPELDTPSELDDMTRSRRDEHGGTTRRSSRTRSASSHTPCVAHTESGTTAYLQHETDVWRRRYVQLEDQLRTVLRERDGLQRQLRRAEQELRSVTSEKQAVLEMNALLKAQLRELCRTSTRAAEPAPSPPTTQTAVSLSPDVLAAAARTLLEQQRVRDATAASQSVATATTPVTSPRRTRATSPDHAATQHLARLQEEIVSLRSQIAATMRHGDSGVEKGATRRVPGTTSRAGSKPRDSVDRRTRVEDRRPSAVVRKGASAVRHYGVQ